MGVSEKLCTEVVSPGTACDQVAPSIIEAERRTATGKTVAAQGQTDLLWQSSAASWGQQQPWVEGDVWSAQQQALADPRAESAALPAAQAGFVATTKANANRMLRIPRVITPIFDPETGQVKLIQGPLNDRVGF